MELWFFVVFFLLILTPLVLGIVIPIFKDHKKFTGGIINYDVAKRKFVYKVFLSSDEIISILMTKNEIDELSCEIDRGESKIKFSEYGSSRSYYYQIQECKGFSILRLEQAARIVSSSHVPYKLNPFMVKKLQAEIIPFSQYGA